MMKKIKKINLKIYNFIIYFKTMSIYNKLIIMLFLKNNLIFY
jgi:hypothetical protein